MGTAADKAPSRLAAAKPAKDLPIRIILADTQAIYRVGIRKIFALEDDLRVVAQAESLPQTLAAIEKHPADVLLFETRVTPNPAEAVSEILKRTPALKLVVLTGECDEDATVEYLRRGARGLVTRAISPDLLIRCVRKVAEGETWLDSRGINWIIDAYRAQAAQLTGARNRPRLSDKELTILSCVTQGMRNKEIAQHIGTTEQVVKNYLRKIYDKLGVSDRLELALYCMHHRLLDPEHAVLLPAQPGNGATAANAQPGPQPVPTSASRAAAMTACGGGLPAKHKLQAVE